MGRGGGNDRPQRGELGRREREGEYLRIHSSTCTKNLVSFRIEQLNISREWYLIEQLGNRNPVKHHSIDRLNTEYWIYWISPVVSILIELFGNRTQSNTKRSIDEPNRTNNKFLPIERPINERSAMNSIEHSTTAFCVFVCLSIRDRPGVR